MSVYSGRALLLQRFVKAGYELKKWGNEYTEHYETMSCVLWSVRLWVACYEVWDYELRAMNRAWESLWWWPLYEVSTAFAACSSPSSVITGLLTHITHTTNVQVYTFLKQYLSIQIIEFQYWGARIYSYTYFSRLTQENIL